MPYHLIKHAATVCLWIASATTVSAQSDVRGHWTGSVDSVGIEVDLDKAASGWIGSFSMPTRGMSGIPLDSVTFADGKASFVIKGSGQRFIGTLSTDGKTLDGSFSSATDAHSAKLARTGEARVELPKTSPAVTPEFLGSWDGTIRFDQLGTPPLRVTLKISNGTEGAEALVISLDQGNSQLPVNTIIQKGTKLTLEVKVAGGVYEGEINQAGTQIDGTWSQMGNSTTLVLKKAPAPAK
jgi:hypothetical protein